MKEYLDVRLTWDKDLGPAWINEDNLKILLFTKESVEKRLLEVEIKRLGHLIDRRPATINSPSKASS